ncbi:MAG: hypothetical protein HYV63_26265 [Candidatus Schekmanbacteria bacterium]|nr:hypothetical protein [Candidatus Schekmanbacteria bacterium]
MQLEDLKPGVIVSGPAFPEPVQLAGVTLLARSVRLMGKGLRTNQFHDPILSFDQVRELTASPAEHEQDFDGDPLRFRLGIEAMRLGLAHEYDSYLALSIARVDPLPPPTGSRLLSLPTLNGAERRLGAHVQRRARPA